MRTQIEFYRVHKPGLARLALIAWSVMLVINGGTHIRASTGIEGNNPMLDWLILVQLICAGIGLSVGVVLLQSAAAPKNGTRIIWAHVVIAGISIAVSPFPVLVAGYWMLFVGAAVLIMGMVRCARSMEYVFTMTSIFYWLGCVMLLKDSTLALIYRHASENLGYQGRLGYASIHPNALGSAAVTLFWLSFHESKSSSRHALRAVYVLIILLSRSRVSMACLVLSGMCYVWMKYADGLWRSKLLRTSMFSFALGMCLLFVLSVLNGATAARSVYDGFNRGQETKQIETFTGRTSIWKNAVAQTLQTNTSILFGHGYGATKKTLEPPRNMSKGFSAHNSFLEFLFSMGIPGAILYVVIVLYGFLWFPLYFQISNTRIKGFVLCIIPVWVSKVLGSVLESSLATRVTPTIILMLFFLALLDRRDLLLTETRLPARSVNHRGLERAALDAR